MGKWKDYDPAWLVRAAKQVIDEYPWLPEKLNECVSAKMESRYYTRFVDAKNPNQPGSDWQFRENITLDETEHGEVVLDVLEGNRIGGVEFMADLMDDS